ncbi:hypothetical protein AZH53_09345 [Methanomicrobiaceae archaeon CYW5]|uniref:class I SAM-dependent methyltransferase n=1 Tax=Methanovulcanius yangii TaxID=1789227 RepID=UPI0029C9E130|nr:class I SAM-dependent methyltransferase [Methanovulcanius yangii]MBT8508608.1 hypothetical protein [Methanovulcanius yangii]
MSYENPGLPDVAVEDLLLYRLGGGFYRTYLATTGLTADERVLEFGCGGGTMSRHILARLGGDGRLTCVDISAFWMEKAMKRLSGDSRATFICGDITTTPLPDDEYDVIFIHIVLHDVPAADRKAIATALASHLAPGGRICIREPINRNHGMPPSEIRALMQAAGLVEVEGTAAASSSILFGHLFSGEFRRP